jgi:DNA-binding NarL/FixJ family response regulator
MLTAIGELLQADFEIVDKVSDGDSLVDAAFKWKPDIIVSDISMPKLSGIEAARRIRVSLPGIKFVFLTMHANSSYRREALSVGAAGYVLKSSAREELAKTVRDASRAAA